MAKDKRTVNAKDVVKNPALLGTASGFQLLRDKSMRSTFENMLSALEIVTAQGWQIAGMSTNYSSSGAIEMYVLLRRGQDGTRTDEPWPYAP